MKRIVFASAIILICLNLTSCTKIPISDDTELSTNGETENGSENPGDH